MIVFSRYLKFELDISQMLVIHQLSVNQGVEVRQQLVSIFWYDKVPKGAFDTQDNLYLLASSKIGR